MATKTRNALFYLLLAISAFFALSFMVCGAGNTGTSAKDKLAPYVGTWTWKNDKLTIKLTIGNYIQSNSANTRHFCQAAVDINGQQFSVNSPSNEGNYFCFYSTYRQNEIFSYFVNPESIHIQGGFASNNELVADIEVEDQNGSYKYSDQKFIKQ